MSDTASVGPFLNELDAQLEAMSKRARQLPEELRPIARREVAVIRGDLLEVTSRSELATLASRYERPGDAVHPVAAALRQAVVDRVHTYLDGPIQIVPPLARAEVKAADPVPSPTVEPTASVVFAARPQQPTDQTPFDILAARVGPPRVTVVVDVQRVIPFDAFHTPDGQRIQSAEPDDPRLRPVQSVVKVSDLVVFQNGSDQKRWGIVDHQHTNGSYVLRVMGLPTVVPAISITHVIDPKKQPDLPVD